MARGFDGYPLTFRVIPPWLVNVEMRGGRRTYQLGHEDVTDEILHIRYQGNTTDAHGHSPLEVGGARMVSVGLLQRYVDNLAQTGGIPLYWLGIERKLNKSEADDLLAAWVESRTMHAGHPAIISGGAQLNQAQSMNAHDMALLELSQFNESRIAILLGVPPFLVGLPGAGGLTYSNVTSLFDFHDRSSLRPKANMVMSALSNWALPRGQVLEANRDDYTRPDFNDRCQGYKILVEIGALTIEEVRVRERFYGQATTAALAVTGGDG
jgi:HK97 family phage portal protein